MSGKCSLRETVELVVVGINLICKVSVRFSQSLIELYGQYKSTTDYSSWRELNFGLSFNQ